MNQFIEVNGYLWPASDRHCRSAVFRTVTDMAPALDLVKNYGVVVQAGGNCGVWPNELAKSFETVYTFEPDSGNYHCLKHNAVANVKHYNVGLGESNYRSGMVRENANNIGAYYIDPLMEGDTVDIVALDDFLELGACDFVCLDIEGYECNALMGMTNILSEFKPVIQLEDKGLSTKYGRPKGYVVEYLRKEFGYELRHQINRDVVLSC